MSISPNYRAMNSVSRCTILSWKLEVKQILQKGKFDESSIGHMIIKWFKMKLSDWLERTLQLTLTWQFACRL